MTNDKGQSTNSRQLALVALQDIYRASAYTDIALDRVLRSTKLTHVDKNLVCELVYGVVRRQRSLDALIDLLGKKKLINSLFVCV
jgi:16S rRNA (cytosine967-C5)-methyltransferase